MSYAPPRHQWYHRRHWSSLAFAFCNVMPDVSAERSNCMDLAAKLCEDPITIISERCIG